MNYKRAPQKFACLGMDLNRPVDLLPPGKYPFLKNVHSYQEGRLETRGAVSTLTTTASSPDTNIISSFLLNDYVLNLFKRFLKIGNSLYYGDVAYTLLDTGYSALPFSPVSYRPDQSARPWVYLGDPFKMRKANTSGENFIVGVIPPTVIPTAELDVPLYKAPAEFDSATGWASEFSAGAVSLGARLAGVTIGTILYDSGTTGWACVAPTGGNYEDITAGMRIILNFGSGNTEASTVEDLHKAYNASAITISQIIYDAGTTGLCTVQPSLDFSNLDRNTLIQLGSEWVRIISVTAASSGLHSFRCITTGAHAAGDAVAVAPNGSFRAYLTNTHVAGETLTANTLSAAITPGSATTPGEGLIAYNYGAGSGINLGNIGNRPMDPGNYLHFSVWMDNPGQLIEGRLILDVDAGTTNAYSTADGTKNAYYLSFTGNNLQVALSGLQTTNAALAASLLLQEQNQVVADFSTNQSNVGTSITPSAQMNLGDSQWTEFRVPIATLIRIGAAQGIDISAVNAIQFLFTVAGNCNIQVANLWVGGGYGPDTSNNLTPFIYRFRYRSSETGAHSLPGPAMRSGITSLRQQIKILVTASTDPQVDKIDIERLGGSNTDGWHYIATVPNTTATYLDQQLSAAILVNPALDTSAYQPFPISDVPRSFTATIAGTAILRTGGNDPVNPTWAIGTEIIVNDIVTTVYAPPIGTAAGIVQVADSIPAGTNILVQINEPILAGQPLPYVWGPFRERLFAVGNVLDGGSVYFTNPGDPDSAPNSNRVECCSPSEGLVHGCVYDGRCYVFSDQRMFSIIPSFSARSVTYQSGTDFDVVPIPNSRGLWAPYALAVGPKIWFLAADGIYETDGGSLQKISTDIDPLFPNGDRLGYAVNGLFPVQMAAPGDDSQISYLRLCYFNNELYFDYRDCHGDPQTLVYDLKDKAWYYYLYFEGTVTKVNFHAAETGFEGNDALSTLVLGTDQGLLYQFSGNGTGVETINCQVDTPALDVGDSRAKKIYGDIVYDFDTQGTDVTCVPYINNYQVPLASDVVNNLMRGISPPQDLSFGVGQFARNIGVRITWSLST